MGNYDGHVKIGTELDDSGLKDGLSKVKDIAKGAVVAAGAAAAGAATAFAGITKSALDSVGSLEQNIGGVETLFKESALAVINNANNAYKTAGMSANEYMQSVTSFSASLLQSVSGDTSEAAKIADMAMVDMSDNANKMGTDMASIQNAYQGFAKQNYTMLDNLKLGYGGTKTEMERLLADAEKISGVKYDINSLKDVYSAIHVIQGELDITGTTAKEASSTIEGSMTSAKAAYDNFLNGSGTAEEFADAVATAADNIATNLGEIVPRLLDTLPTAVTAMTSQIPVLVRSLLPPLVSSGTDLIHSFCAQLPTMATALFEQGLPLLEGLTANIRENAGVLVNQGIDLILQLAQGLIDGIPALLQYVPQIVINIAGIINDNAPKILAAGAKLVVMMAKGLIKAIPDIIAAAPKIIEAIVSVIQAFNWLDLGKNIIALFKNGITSMAGMVKSAGDGIFNAIKSAIQNLPQTLLNLGKNAISSLSSGISGMLGTAKSAATGILNGIVSSVTALPSKLLALAKNAVQNIVKSFKGESWSNIGNNIITGIASGITGSVGKIVSAAKNAAKKAYEAAKDFLGINSPSKLMRDMIGKNMIAGFESGIVSETPNLEKTSAGSAQKAVESMQGVALGRSGTVASAVENNLNPNPGGGNGGNPVVVLEKGSITGDVTMDGEKVGTIVAPTVDIEIEKARKESER